MFNTIIKIIDNPILPKEYEFRESLPKTMIGKVNNKELEKEINNKS